MSRLIAGLLLALTLAACTPGEAVDDSPVRRWVDPENGVTCYVWGSTGMDCIGPRDLP